MSTNTASKTVLTEIPSRIVLTTHEGTRPVTA